MLGKILPVLIGLVGLAAGTGAAYVLRPDPAAVETTMNEHGPCGDVMPVKRADPLPAPDDPDSEFVEMSNQFVLPVIEGSRVVALVVVSLSLEIEPEQSEAVMMREPKLRDGFLRVMLDHSNVGGFQGTFTANGTVDDLRRALIEVGRKELGPVLHNVLITAINRQDS